MAAMEAPAVDPSSVWAAATGDLREAPGGKGGDAEESREAIQAKATARHWAAATTPLARETVSSTTPPETQANRFAYRILQQYVSTPKYHPLIFLFSLLS
jgi:hypothetical protein